MIQLWPSFFLQKKIYALTFLCVCFLFSSTTTAQYPAAVSTDIHLWHKGDDIVPLGSGQYKVNWPNAIPNPVPRSSEYKGAASYQMQAKINGYHAVPFDDEYFEAQIDISDNTTFNELHVFTVYKPTTTGGSQGVWGNGMKNSNRKAGRRLKLDKVHVGSGIPPKAYLHKSGLKSEKDNVYINHVNVKESSPSFVCVNGTIMYSFTAGTTILNCEKKMYIGTDRQGQNGKDLSIAEVIVFSGSMSLNKRKKITSYLAIKYGLSIAHDYYLADGTEVWKTGINNGEYDNNIIGVVNDSTSNGRFAHQLSVSQETGDYLELSVNGGFDVATNSYALMAGHNDKPTTATVPFDAGRHFLDDGTRIERVWKAEQLGGYQNYSVGFTPALLNNLPPDFKSRNLVLLVADAPSFGAGANTKAYPLVLSNRKLKATNVDFDSSTNTSTKYFTIGFLETGTWVMADAADNVITSGQVTTLRDQAMGINDLEGQNMTGFTEKPKFITPNTMPNPSRMNFKPFVKLNQGSQRNYLVKEDYAGFGIAGSAIFMVARNKNTSTTIEQALFSYATKDATNTTRANGNDLVMLEATNISMQIGAATGSTQTNFDITYNRPVLLSNQQGKNTNNIIGIDGYPFSTTYANSQIVHDGGTLVIGQEQDDMNVPNNFDINQQLEGDLAELIVCSKRLTPDKVQKIHSYLALKYGIFLKHDYISAAGDVIWDKAANSAYDKNVAGIGYDNAFLLDHSKSRSQDTAAILTIEKTAGPNVNASFLLWGSLKFSPGTTIPANYDTINVVDAPAGFTLSERRWKVSNPGNKIRAVNVHMDIPSSMTSSIVNASGISLAISGSSTFATGLIAAEKGSYNATTGKIDFLGVTLEDGQYFTLGFNEDLSFSNNDIGAPSTFEACAMSNVTFRYDTLLRHPSVVQFNSSDPNKISAKTPHLTPVNTGVGSGGNGVKGEITFSIPHDAATGSVLFLDNNSDVIYRSNNFITIHNPNLSIIPQTDPICADRPIKLYGFPKGGQFTSNIPGLISPSKDSLYSSKASWGVNHKDSIIVDVTYSYRAEYSNGKSCATAKELTDSLIIRDNRLFKLTYTPVFKGVGSSNRFLKITDSTILSTTPNILPPSSFPHPYTFTGTYVTPAKEFLADNALASNPVTFRFNNKGCIGEITSDIDVFNPLGIPGIPDTLCAQSDTIFFSRDPNPKYKYASKYDPSRSGRVDSNLIVKVVTTDSTHQAAILVLDSTKGSERYGLLPSLLPANTSNVQIRMIYRTILTTTTGSVTTINEFSAVSAILIVPPEVAKIGNSIDPVYCTTQDPDTMRPSPAFDNPSTTFFSIVGQDSLGSFRFNDSLFQDTIFVASMIYDSLVPYSTRDLSLMVMYTVDRYGCKDIDTVNTIIRAPRRPFFATRPAYCKNGAPFSLTGTLPGGITGKFLPAIGLDTSLGVFDPKLAVVDTTPVTLVITDQHACEYDYTGDIVVREPPGLSLTLDGQRGVTRFCGSDTSVDIRATLISGSALDSTSITYFGAGVLDSTFNPNSVFVTGQPGSPGYGTGGTSPVWAQIVDTFGCKGYDTLVVTIIQAPAIDIDSVFNHKKTNYNTLITTDHTYCRSAPTIVVDGNPRHFTGSPASITGKGIILIDTTYYYDPSLVPTDTDIDTVIYTYTDVVGCSNKDIAIIKIDSMPNVSLMGFTGTDFCPNYPPVTLTGSPDTISSGGQGSFGGDGMNTNAGIFEPSLAGTGLKLITYRFIDNNRCENTDTVRIFVHTLPNPMFDGYLSQYCTAGADDTLRSLNDTTGSFRFYGSIITDSIGILSPSADTVGSSTTTGTKTVYYSYTDLMNCTNVDSVNIFIHPTPEITINGLDSVYCFSDDEDNISVSPVGTLDAGSSGFTASGNMIVFDPDEDTSGVKTFTYSYRDNNGCSDTIVARTYVYRPTPPIINNLKSFYCETKDTYPISGTPSWGGFTGRGIEFDSTGNIWSFTPRRAGSGNYTVTYSVEDTLRNYILAHGQVADSVCPAERRINVTIRPLPTAKLASPANNSAYCSNDSMVPLIGAPYANKTWEVFTDTSRGLWDTVKVIRIDTLALNPFITAEYSDTVYFFNPSAVIEGAHQLGYIATDSASGCSDTLNFTLIVDAYTKPLFSLDSVYCESADPILLFGTPSGGEFARNSVPIVGTPPYFLANPGYSSGQYLNSTIYDTVTYTFVDGACEGVDTQQVKISPVPQISYTSTHTHNTYCTGGDTILLTPNIPGGFFTGAGVPFGTNYFIPDFAGRGLSEITYTLIDKSTGCDNTFLDSLYVYTMPTVDYMVSGGCQSDSVYFEPNNAVLGFLSTSQAIDSITNIQWIMSSSDFTTGIAQGYTIDTLPYMYNSAGVYMTQLIVANREHCIDTQTVRLVISPKIDSFPYEQDFQVSAGNWYAESRGSEYDSLWNWGADNNKIGIPVNPNNNIWATRTGAPYGSSEDAWVYSPCFDISSLTRPMMSLDYWTHTRKVIDGTVLEYQKTDGTWAPVGQQGRGIDWFNTPFIAAQPGSDSNRVLSLGWSGKSKGWQNGRYKLDNYRGANNIIRMRIAFASEQANPGGLYDGFAFDNFVVRNRTRNVLLETMVNRDYSNMENINNKIYNLVFHTDINKDVVLLQYHMEKPNDNDAFYLNNPTLGRNRAYEYGVSFAGRSYINGYDSTNIRVTSNVKESDFEQDMLESPKFSIDITEFTHKNNDFIVRATVKALEPSNFANYRIYTIISEDSLHYPLGSSYISELHAVVRENDQFHLNSSVNTQQDSSLAWNVGDSMTINFVWDHSSHGFINYEEGDFQAVVFIQNTSTKEVFQVATTRDISGYTVGAEPVQAAKDLGEIQHMTLFPNPAHDYFNLKFDQALEKDYQWKLVDIRGVEVRQGQVSRGTEQFTVEGLNVPSGTYILLLYNKNAFTQRRVVLGRP